MAQVLLGLAIALTILGCGTTGVGALTVGPTNWRSSITSVTPVDEDIAIEVIDGGDALRLTAQSGHRVGILGYQGEPYLQLTDDGRVEANLRSPTWWANLDGSGTGPVPESATPDADPEWTTIASGNSVLWHDHRVHAMPGVTDALEWKVLVTVDDLPVEIRGRLARLPSPSTLPEVILAIICVGIVVSMGFRWAWSVSLGATIMASTLAMLVAVSMWTATPKGFSHPWTMIFTALASVVLGVAAVLLRRSAPRRRLLAIAGALASLAWWIALMFPSFTAAFIPSSLPASVVRSSLALVAGAVVGVTIIVIITGGFTDTVRTAQADATDRTGAPA